MKDHRTDTVQVAAKHPSTVVAIIRVNPGATPVITPFNTDATWEFKLVHITALLGAFAGVTVATIEPVPRTRSLRDRVESDTPDTRVSVTVTEVVAVFPPSAVVAVILTEPVVSPVTRPVGDTDAIVGLLLL
jgi:hypothetical protein